MFDRPTPADHNGLLEYSVVYTDRSLNHMSPSFQQVMRDISNTLKELYGAYSVAVVPGGGTFGMEAVARQLATNKTCLVIRNGWFSYRWTQIFEAGNIPSKELVIKAKPIDNGSNPHYAPPALEDVLNTIHRERPNVVFAAHVETSAGMMLPDDYIKKVSQAVHAVGGIFVLDCIASGTLWVNMKELGVDVLITAPQKGWSGSPCAALVLMSEQAHTMVKNSESSSFSCNLKAWLNIMEKYESGGHAYHATMPTDSLKIFRDVMMEAKSQGFELLKERQVHIGTQIRNVLSPYFKSLAAPGFQAPSVVVCYTDNIDIKTGRAFSLLGMQIAAGVPLNCDEATPFKTFRLGLFGLDKLMNPNRTVSLFKKVLTELTQREP
ncbi:MAG: aminotransferase [Proteobacteria bacterium]|nr:aminotransferase [Pseudomonadota bacterium]